MHQDWMERDPPRRKDTPARSISFNFLHTFIKLDPSDPNSPIHPSFHPHNPSGSNAAAPAGCSLVQAGCGRSSTTWPSTRSATPLSVTRSCMSCLIVYVPACIHFAHVQTHAHTHTHVYNNLYMYMSACLVHIWVVHPISRRRKNGT